MLGYWVGFIAACASAFVIVSIPIAVFAHLTGPRTPLFYVTYGAILFVALLAGALWRRRQMREGSAPMIQSRLTLIDGWLMGVQCARNQKPHS